MLGRDFIFDNKCLSEFDMIICAPENEQQFVSREIIRSDITHLRPVPNHYSVKYSDTLTLYFLIVRNDENSVEQSELALNSDEISLLRSWLESSTTPTKLTVIKNSNTRPVHYYGLFTDVQPLIVGEVCYGLYLTFTCNAPYGFSDIYTQTYKVSSAETQGVFYNASADKNSYIKPVVKIYAATTFGSNNSISICNKSNNNKTITFKLPNSASALLIDCDKKIITDENGRLIPLNELGVSTPVVDNYSFFSTETYMVDWFELVPGVNELSINTASFSKIDRVEISTRFVIKAGGF